MNEKQKARIVGICLEKVKSGLWTEDTCLEIYPDLRQELLDVFSVSRTLSQYQVANISSQRMRSMKQQLMFKLNDRKELVTKPRRIRYTSQNTKRRFAMTWIVIVATLFSILSGGGVVYASGSALPGDALYPVKTWVEDFQLAISTDENDTLLYEEFAGRRISEFVALADADKIDGLDLVVEGYRNRNELMEKLMAKIESENPDNALKLRTELESRLKEHARILEGFLQESELDQDNSLIQQRLRIMLQTSLQTRQRLIEDQASENDTVEVLKDVVEDDVVPDDETENEPEEGINNQNRVQNIPEEYIENGTLKFQFRFEQDLESGVYAEVEGASFACGVEGAMATCDLTGVPASGRLNLYRQDTGLLLYSYEFLHEYEYLWKGSKENEAIRLQQEGQPDKEEDGHTNGQNGKK